MSLHFILDGYNIIKSDIKGILTQGTLEEQRDRLVELINVNNPQGSQKNKVTIVFDGPASIPFMDTFSSRYHDGSVEIVFSEGKTADKRIEEIVLQSNAINEFVIVTNDKGIRRLLGGTNTRFMPVSEFLIKLFKINYSKNNVIYNNSNIDDFDKINEEFKKKWLK